MMKQKRAHDLKIVRAKENLNTSYGEPSQRQTSGQTNGLKLYDRAVTESKV